MSEKTREFKALWGGGKYAVIEKAWYSYDGNWWKYANGDAVCKPEFDECRITLNGGPRDGDVVA